MTTHHPSSPTGASAADTAGVALAHAPVAHPTLLQIARERYATLTELLEAASSEPSVDWVHDLRVATRRMTEVARILEPAMGEQIGAAVAGSLRDVRQGAGDLRDLDVLEEHLERWRLPRPLGTIRRDILETLPARRAELVGRLLLQLNAGSFSGAKILLAQILERQSNDPAALQPLVATLVKRIKQRRKQMGAGFGKAARKQTSEALHGARIGVKRLRYVLELAHETGGGGAGVKGVRQQLRFLKGMQKLLGDMHDADVIVATLERHLKEPRYRGLKGLRPAWGKWRRGMQRLQAKRAAIFFSKSYMWINQQIK